MEAPLIEKLKIYNAEVQRKCSQLVDVRGGPFESTATFTGLVYSFITAGSRGRMRISLYTKRKKKKANYRHHILLNIHYSHSRNKTIFYLHNNLKLMKHSCFICFRSRLRHNRMFSNYVRKANSVR